jgi:hypothetical protein
VVRWKNHQADIEAAMSAAPLRRGKIISCGQYRPQQPAIAEAPPFRDRPLTEMRKVIAAAW